MKNTLWLIDIDRDFKIVRTFADFHRIGRRLIFRCAEKLKSAFDGTLNEPLGALMITSMAADWDFYFIPVQQGGKIRLTDATTVF